MNSQEIIADISSICQVIPKEINGHCFAIQWMGFGWQIGYKHKEVWSGPLYQSGIRGKSETLEEALCEFIKLIKEYEKDI